MKTNQKKGKVYCNACNQEFSSITSFQKHYCLNEKAHWRTAIRSRAESRPLVQKRLMKGGKKVDGR